MLVHAVIKIQNAGPSTIEFEAFHDWKDAERKYIEIVNEAYGTKIKKYDSAVEHHCNYYNGDFELELVTGEAQFSN